MNGLANLSYRQDKLDKAQGLFIECIDKSKTALGPLHPETLSSMNNLGCLYSRRKEYAKAKALFDQCLEGFTTTFGRNHTTAINVIISMRLIK